MLALQYKIEQLKIWTYLNSRTSLSPFFYIFYSMCIFSILFPAVLLTRNEIQPPQGTYNKPEPIKKSMDKKLKSRRQKE